MKLETNTKMIVGGGALVVLAIAAVIALSNGADEERMEGMDSMEGMEMEGMEMEGGDIQGRDMQEMGGMSMDGAIRLSSDEIHTFGITFGTAEVRPLRRTIRSVGVVEFDETRMTYVAPKFGGWVERLHVDFTGRSVDEGEPLLEVYAPELVTAQEELMLAARMAGEMGDSQLREVAGGARELLASARRRLEYWDISEEQIDRLLETGEVRRTLTLHAPASGVVMEKRVSEGQAFQPGTNLYLIAGLSEVWVNAELFESDAGLVREGMPAEVTVAALPGRTFHGRIGYVYPTLEERTRSMRARIALANPGGALKPGMYATVRMTSDLGETLTLPATAVLYTGERAVTFVDMGGGELMPHELDLGVRGGDFVQVLSGVEPGDRVVTSAQFLLDSESNLAEIMQAMMAQMGLSGAEGMDMEGMDPPLDSVRPDSTGRR